MKRNRIFIDMDGVLAVCNPKGYEEMLKPDYFYNLKPRVDMLEAVKHLVNLNGNEVYILSSVIPEIEESAKADKNRWLDNYLPEIDSTHRIFTLCGENKAEAIADINETDILCDDYSENLSQWTRSGGTGIKILNEVNGLHGTYQAGPRLKINRKEDLAETIRKIA